MERQQEGDSICWFTSQRNTTARAGPGRTPGARNSILNATEVPGTFGLFPVAFPGAVPESRIESGGAATPTL